jgi:hypothetical protein
VDERLPRDLAEKLDVAEVLAKTGQVERAIADIKSLQATDWASNSATLTQRCELDRRLAFVQINAGQPEGIYRLERHVSTLKDKLGSVNQVVANAQLELGQAREAQGLDGTHALADAYAAQLKIWGKQTFSSYVSVSANAYAHALGRIDPNAAIKVQQHAIDIFDQHWGTESSLSIKARQHLEQLRAKLSQKDLVIQPEPCAIEEKAFARRLSSLPILHWRHRDAPIQNALRNLRKRVRQFLA